MKFQLDFVFRKKTLQSMHISNSKLSRVMSVFDLTALGSIIDIQELNTKFKN